MGKKEREKIGEEKREERCRGEEKRQGRGVNSEGGVE